MEEEEEIKIGLLVSKESIVSCSIIRYIGII